MERNRIFVARALCIGAGALLPSAAAAADTKVLHKCVDAKGITSIQAAPCAKGSKEVWARATEPAVKPTEADVAAARARETQSRAEVTRQADELQRRLAPTTTPTPPPGSHLAGTPTEGTHLANTNNPREGSQLAPVTPEEPPQPNASAINNCQAAQAFSTAVREKSWIGLTEDQTRRIFGWVAEQCRVQTKVDD